MDLSRQNNLVPKNPLHVSNLLPSHQYLQKSKYEKWRASVQHLIFSAPSIAILFNKKRKSKLKNVWILHNYPARTVLITATFCIKTHQPVWRLTDDTYYILYKVSRSYNLRVGNYVKCLLRVFTKDSGRWYLCILRRKCLVIWITRNAKS